MKLAKFLFIGLTLFALAVPARASVKQVTTVSSTASTILTPVYAHLIVIQNNGTGGVRLSLDGGPSFNVQGAHGTDPTATTGLVLAAGASITIQLQYPNQTLPPIRAILQTGTTTTLDIVTDDQVSN